MNLPAIVRDAKEGNDLARQHLISAMREPMMVLCRRYIKDPRDAEERMLDGFYRCFTKLPAFEYESYAMFYAWLKTIMIRECLAQLKKKQCFILVPESEPDEVAIEPEAMNKLAAKEIYQFIDELPAGYRTVFNLNLIDGIEHKEIAVLLGIKESTSRSQLTKARVFLQKKLTENGYNQLHTRPMECPKGENE